MNATLVNLRSQQGVSLLVVLILLLIMTLLGLAAMRGSILQERMAANLTDRNLAFQAAETALRDGEALAQGFAVASVPASGCTGGMCSLPVATATDRWKDASFAGWTNATSSVSTNAMRPQYFVEFMGMAPTWPGCDLIDEANRSPLCMAPRYRVTARSRSNDGSRAEVILQTNYLVQ